MTGEGVLFDEEGGAGALVTRAIQTISRQWSRRGPATRLTETFLAIKGVPDAFSLFEGLALKQIQLVPDDVKIIFRIADEGDPVAQEIVIWAGEKLADLACGVIRQLDLEKEKFEVVLVGSLWKSGERLISATRRVIQETAPQAALVLLPVPPVVGGVLLGMRQAGLSNPRLRKILVRNFLEWRKG